jgi:hypothetical protein
VLIANVASDRLDDDRELARHGVEVHGLSDDPHGIGATAYLASSAVRERGALVAQAR